MSLKSLIYSRDSNSLKVLDQLKVPHEKTFIDILTVEDGFSVIKSMQVRGAPLIAMVAMLALSVDLNSKSNNFESADQLLAAIQQKLDYLVNSRPTAVNLANATTELSEKLTKLVTEDGNNTVEQILEFVTDFAEHMLASDVVDNKFIGAFGAEAILTKCNKQQLNLMTICNTGSLATAEYGTALGVVRALQEKGKLNSITCLETRPYNQGSRLTAFELLEEKMPGACLICDSMAAACMKLKGIDAVVVGADRVCANGDTTNKIGTYQLAIVASHHGVPFYVASPFTTLDTKLPSGDAVPIEERPSSEFLESSFAPKDMPCWNPSFDVTPAALITGGIITEKGVICKRNKEDGSLDVVSFVNQHR